MKLKYTQIKSYREETLIAQNNQCALCGTIIVDDAVLDHDHKSGLIRRVLHRGCNSLLGKIENSLPRSRVDLDQLEEIAKRLIEYIKTKHTDLVHPTYKTKEERKMSKMGRGRGRGKKPPKR
jgi:hypothetical protein